MFARMSLGAQLVELAVYVAVALGLGIPRSAGAPGLVAWIAGAFLATRFALVCASMALGWHFRAPRAPQHRIGAWRTAALVAGEWRSLVACTLVYMPWERWTLRPDPPLAPAARLPVILVHGYFANRAFFRPLVRHLEAAGVGPVHVPSFRTFFASIETFERELDACIERIVAASGQPQAVLVAHSMGGLAARAYLARHGAAKVARLVTIASPHHGTALAAWGVGENARQMERGSPFIAALAAAERDAPRVPALAIYSPHDNMVAPQDSACLPWARTAAFPGRGHIAIAADAAVAELVRAEIEAARG